VSESIIYARTGAGNADLGKAHGKIAGDAKLVMSLVDGTASVDAISKKIPPSVRKHIREIFVRLQADRFVTEVGKVEIVAPIKLSGRIPNEKVKEAMRTSQKFNKDMLVLAEIEIERRMELEQDLAASQAKFSEMAAHLNTVMSKYDTLKEQVLLYKQGMEARIAAQQAQLAALSGKSQTSLTQKEELEHELKAMRNDFQHMQSTIEQKSARMDEMVQVRVLQQQQAEIEKRNQQNISADEMVQTHPHFHEIRSLEFFKKFRNSDLAQLLSWTEWRDVKSGEIVVTEGQSDITFYVIVSGKLGLIKGKKTIQILQSGEPFGEIAYLAGDEPRRSATVVARSDCSLLMFNPAYLDDAELMIRVLFAEAFMRVQAKRLRTTIEMVGNLLVEGAH
jgi:outer membrane murein-binding lipoprotein Lpp